MTTKLELRFKTSEGKSKMIGVSQPILNLDSAVVEAAMKTIVDQNMFKKEDVNLLESIKGARYVTRTVDDLFEIE
ncbi:DUF2922 domain-containing protein [Marinilactibacillus psychrotolerans]|uniref:DUF2922 domain-containing protein n=1 Tax=Marinilactibacillus psychrotolerans TaxID=191770 RepID=A0AAV3WX56_9LACT|nr:DUF2922 domain-containing protein [Marinilactibacillus psychrotolerans]GEL66386.1 hypothetical protein MPS01_05410 [Marinilactibacillus psychrotolerans]GEQ36707.1 hypothetical protein M132T_22150 [Marinilactibacillus psychrotolerans]SDD17113.1 Protein of unknown function [Marinilactibacillus psychrotolerans]